MEGRFEGAILTGAISVDDRYQEEKESCWLLNALLVEELLARMFVCRASVNFAGVLAYLVILRILSRARNSRVPKRLAFSYYGLKAIFAAAGADYIWYVLCSIGLRSTPGTHTDCRQSHCGIMLLQAFSPLL